jgi:hypothetical protein
VTAITDDLEGGEGEARDDSDADAWQAQQPAAEADRIRDIERMRLKALVDADLETAGRLHADAFQLITPRGVVLSKDQYLGAIANGDLKYVQWDAGPIEVRLHGDTAVIRYRAQLETGSAGTTGSMECWHTDSYEKLDGAWQVVWSQATRIT